MKNTRTNKNHNTNKKIKTAVIATLTTLTLGFGGVSTAIYLQPSHYKGDTFKNAKTSVSSTTSSTSSSSSSQAESTNDSNTNNYYVYTESNSAEVTNNYSQEVNNSSNQVNNNQSEQTTNNNQSQQTTNNSTQVEQNTGDRAYQPTFKVECLSPKNDFYCVEHIHRVYKTKAITYEQADAFCKYMEQIAHGKTYLSYTMDENYNTWESNN